MNYCPHSDIKSELKLILAASAEWIRISRMSDVEFANACLVPSLEAAGLIDDNPTTADELFRVRNKYAKRVARILSGDSPLPFGWREAWLAALPGDVAANIMRSTARMHGYMLVQVPTTTGTGSVEATIDVLAGAFADVMSHAHPAFDGTYGTEDELNQLLRLEQELVDLKEATAAEIARVRAGLMLHKGAA
ncbi:hypothetical protein ACQP3R_22445 [Bacillus inaquosorum]|uniref:hypothetical protein n=1 Tax=Bacillus inaquosorum TaxID=483913 RepID=UPI003CFC7593